MLCGLWEVTPLSVLPSLQYNEPRVAVEGVSCVILLSTLKAENCHNPCLGFADGEGEGQFGMKRRARPKATVFDGVEPNLECKSPFSPNCELGPGPWSPVLVLAASCRWTHSMRAGLWAQGRTSSWGLTAQKSDSRDRHMPSKGRLLQPLLSGLPGLRHNRVAVDQASVEFSSAPWGRSICPVVGVKPQGREWPPGGSKGPRFLGELLLLS